MHGMMSDSRVTGQMLAIVRPWCCFYSRALTELLLLRQALVRHPRPRELTPATEGAAGGDETASAEAAAGPVALDEEEDELDEVKEAFGDLITSDGRSEAGVLVLLLLAAALIRCFCGRFWRAFACFPCCHARPRRVRPPAWRGVITKGAREGFLRPPTAEEILQRLSGRHWCAAHVFPCLRGLPEKALASVVAACGEDPEADRKYVQYDFSLLHGKYLAPLHSDSVELEGVPGRPLSGAEHRKAVERLEAFYHPLVPLGCALYALTLGGGFVSGLLCECAEGPEAWGFVFPAVAICLQVYWLEKMTLLLSQTQVEGREVLRLLMSLGGLDNYRVMAAIGVVDVLSRFSRAQFVGYVQHCHEAVDKPFAEAFKHDFARRMMDLCGLRGLAFCSFIAGPIMIQFAYMLRVRRKIQIELKEAREKRPPVTAMNVMDSVDDLGALMGWAMLAPAARVMDLASVPLNLDDDADVDRLWDRMVTQVLVVITRDIPDGVLQMYLQAWFFCLVYRCVAWPLRAQLLLNIVLASVGVCGDAIDLVLQNRRITVCAGVFLLLLLTDGFARTAGAFLCGSAVKNADWWQFRCIPVAQMRDCGNWTISDIPG